MKKLNQKKISRVEIKNLTSSFHIFFKNSFQFDTKLNLKKSFSFILFAILFNSLVFAQAPSISYTSVQTSYIINNNISPLTPTNIGGVPIPRTNVTTYAGCSASGNSDGSAASPKYYTPTGIAVSTSGNIYIADSQNHCIRKISASGYVSTIAGTGIAGFLNGNASIAQFNLPYSIAVDASENLYVTESNSYAVRKISAAGMVSTLAGNITTAGFLDGQNSTALFSGPKGLAVDLAGNVYVADSNNNCIRKISSSGNVITIAGDGTAGYLDGQGTSAKFNKPIGIAVTSSGILYITDSFNNRIRSISSSGLVTTFAGSSSGFVEGQGIAAQFNGPRALAIDMSENLYVVDYNNNRIRKITNTGLVTTLSGTGSFGAINGLGTVATFKYPEGIALDSSGNAFVADVTNNCIRKITASGDTSTYSGTSVNGLENGQGGTIATFNSPVGVAVTSTGITYVIDEFSSCIRKISNGMVTTLAGDPAVSGFLDGQGILANFNNPKGIAVDSQGNIYVADTYNNRIRKITSSGTVTTIAGNGTAGYLDGQGTAAQFYNPYSLTVDNLGNIYVADTKNYRIRKISNTGLVTTVAGYVLPGFLDGASTVARFKNPQGVAIDNATGILYVADSGNHKIRKIATDGTVSTFAGSSVGYTDDQGILAKLNNPIGITVDAFGNLYVGDYYNSVIRKISSSGLVSTYAGNGISDYVNGIGNVASFYFPVGVGLDITGNVYVADSYTQRIRKISTVSPYTITPALPSGISFNSTTGVLSGTPTEIRATTTYSIGASNYNGTSTTAINFATVDITTTSGPPTASSQTFCNSATVANLVANGTALQWYNVSTGGTALTLTTALVTGNYYVSQTVNSIESTRTTVAVTINSTVAPLATAQTFCTAASVSNLVATGTSLKWYNVSTGGTALASTTALTTGSYYVSQTLNSCESSRTTVAVTINSTVAPLAIAQTFCIAASVSNLVATGSALQWYTAATGGTVLASTTALTTGSYYVSQTLNSCESLRTTVPVTINTTLATTAVAQTFCTAASVSNLVATGTSLKWYNVSTGGTALASTTALTTGSYYVSQTLNSCESLRTTVPVTINTTVAPTAVAQTFSNSATVANLVATGSALQWYTSATGGTVLALSTALSTGTYYVSQTLNSCESPRISVSVTVNTAPGAPTASSQTFCNSATVANLVANGTTLQWYNVSTGGTALTLTTALVTGNYYVSQTVNSIESTRTTVAVTIYTSAAPSATTQVFCNWASVSNLVATGTSLKWYSVSTGGTALASTTALTTGSYYVSQTLHSCESSRTTVPVTINTTVAPTAVAQTFSNSATVANLVATGSALQWYTAATGGTVLALSTALSTGTYYVSQILNSCESPRISVSVTVNTAPGAPIASSQTFCNSATVANLVANGIALQWYNVSIGGTALTLTTALVTGNYYVSQTVNSVESTRTTVAVTINTTVAPTASSQTFCTSATVSNLVGTGTTLKWYNVSTGGAALASTTALTTGSYYVSQTLNSCESLRTPISVTIKSLSNITLPYDASICSALGSTTNILSTSNEQLTNYIWEYRVVSATSIGNWVTINSSNASTVYSNYNTVNLIINRNTTLPTIGTEYRVTATGLCGNVQSNVLTLKIIGATKAGSISSVSSVCSGESIVFSLTGYVGTSIQWQTSATPLATSTPPANWVNIINENAPQYTALFLTSLSNKYYRVVVSNSCLNNEAVTATKTITVYNPSNAGTASGGTDVCLSSPTKITLKVSGYLGTIQWEYSINNGVSWNNTPSGSSTTPFIGSDFSTISTGKSSSYVVYGFSQSALFRVHVSNGSCLSATSNTVECHIATPTATRIISENTIVCYGTGTMLTLTSGYVGTIKWMKSTNYGALGSTATWTAMSGTSSTILTGNITVTTWYKSILSVGLSCASETVPIVISVYVKPISKSISSPTLSGSISAPICTSSLKILNIISGYLADTIQWEKVVVPLNSTLIPTSADYLPIIGANEASYTVTDAVEGKNYYRVKFTNGGCLNTAVYSSAFIVYDKNCYVANKLISAISYPNPFIDNFSLSIKTSSGDKVGIKIYDMTGRLLEQSEINLDDVSELKIGDQYPTGIYNVIINQGNELKTLRVIKR